MKPIFYLFFLCAFYLPLTLAAFDYELSTEKEEFSFTCKHKLILVHAEIEGQYGLFIFDTGASELILNDRYFTAKRHIGTLKVRDIGSVSKLEKTYVKTFEWGAVHRKNFEAVLTDLSATEAMLGEKILGLIGYDVIKNFEVIVDYYGQRISLWTLDNKGAPVHPAYPTQPQHVFSFEQHSHLPILQVTLSNGKRLELALDSGATVNLLNHHCRKKIEDLTLSKRKITSQGLTSTLKDLDIYNLDELLIENQLGIRYWRAGISDLSHFADSDIFADGFIGINFFQFGTVAINYRRGEIRVWEGGEAYLARHFCLEHQEPAIKNDPPYPVGGQ